MDRWMEDGCMERWMDEYKDGRTDGRMGRCMDGRMNGWRMDG